MRPRELPRRGFLGLTLGSAPTRGSDGLGLPIVAVMPGSSAARMGILAGDRLTHVEQNPARELGEVRRILRTLRAGDPVVLDVAREDETRRFEGTVVELPREEHPGARTELGEVRVGAHRQRSIAIVPDGPGPFPCVYYLPGAHWASEERPFEPEHPVTALASALVAAGIAFFRVERSGVGDSEGPACTSVGFAEELAGFRAGLDALRAMSWAEPERLFLFGHSLGAMVAPLLAERARVAGVITFGASAVPISEALVGAVERHAELDSPHRPAALARAEKIAELVRLVVAGSTPAAVFRERPDLAAAAPAHFTGDHAYHRVVRFYHELERAELVEAWSKLHTDVLLLHGEHDSITTLEDSARLARVVGPRATVLELGGVDHQLSAAGPRDKPRLAASLRDAVLGWLTARLG